MRIFLYEHLCGGGFLSSGLQPGGSLLAEGRAMLTALAADFAALPGVQLATLLDARLAGDELLCEGLTGCRTVRVSSRAEHAQAFRKGVQGADWAVVIAPEFEGALADWCERARSGGGRLLAPSPSFLRIASDKWLTYEVLRQAKVPTPKTKLAAEWDPARPAWPGPWVVKPRLGAGSQGVRLMEPESDSEEHWQTALASGTAKIIQPYHPGTAASVAVLAGPAGALALAACRQRLSQDGNFAYQGGELPLPAKLNERAWGLAQRTLAALPPPLGYVGFDLILGPAEDGSQDFVVEINPRLTTSYLGYRAAYRENLAGAMLAAATGEPCELSLKPGTVTFECGGAIRQTPAA